MIENSTDGDNKCFVHGQPQQGAVHDPQLLADICASLNHSLSQLNEIMLEPVETILTRVNDARGGVC
eukprot:26510-Eustigmatos_ZCMA.PRE.1